MFFVMTLPSQCNLELILEVGSNDEHTRQARSSGVAGKQDLEQAYHQLELIR